MKERYHLPYIIGIAVLCRFAAVVVFLHAKPLPRLNLIGFENIAIALSIHNGQGYSSPFLIPSGATAMLPPGYPLLIAAMIRLFGTGAQTGVILIALNVVFSLGTLIVILKTARKHFGRRVANLSSIIFAIAPPAVLAPLWIWDTCLSALILISAFALAPVLSWKSEKSIFVGVGVGLAVLVNPALLVALVAIFGWSAWRARTTPWVAIAAFLIVWSPWPIRNALAMHTFIPLRSNFGYELWVGNHPGASGESSQNQGPGYEPAERRLFLQQGELGYYRLKESFALTFISNHPAEFARLTGKRFLSYWMGSADSLSIFSGWLTVLGMVGLAMLWKQRSLFTLFALPLALFPLPYYITHADARFQYILNPLLTILAGYACECFFAWCARRPAPSPSLTATVS